MTLELEIEKMTNARPEIVTIAGTRPEIIKLAEFARLIKGRSHAMWYTGQHFSENMRDIFFQELGMSADLDLRCNTSDINVLKNNILRFLRAANPKWVIIYGDTYSSMAGALAAKEVGSKLIHLEAGIRDLDSTVPEEGVRIYIDSVSDYLFAPTELARSFLSYEGVAGKVDVTGNLISDVCKKLAAVPYSLKTNDLPDDYLLLTMHRPENVDDPEKLSLLAKHIGSLKYPVVFPIHPRTRKNLIAYNILLPSNVIAVDPVSYMEFLNLLKNCKLVMTDSGGVTEEAIILKKPCITLRHTTARWETILLKANILFPLDRKDPLSKIIDTMLNTKITKNPYGENVAERTIRIIDKIVS
jgi:UDP-N-acetylglucosamine 2-epimerase (non-hydrolysing)